MERGTNTHEHLSQLVLPSPHPDQSILFTYYLHQEREYHSAGRACPELVEGGRGWGRTRLYSLLMSTHKIATSTLWQLTSQAITMVIGILGIKLTTIALSRELVGNYQTVYSYLQIFGILADFGLYAVSLRELSRATDRALTFGTLFLLRAVITCISLGVAIVFAWVLPSFRGTPLPLGITIAALVPFFTLLAGMFRTLFQVEYRMHFVFVSEVLGKIVPVLLMAGAVFLGVKGEQSVSLYYYFLGFGGAGSLLLFLLSLWFARPLFKAELVLSQSKQPTSRGLLGVCLGLPKLYQAEIWRILRLATPYGLAFLATTIYRQSDVTLIAMLRPDYDLQNASYGVALRIAEVGFLLPTLVLNSALPILSEKKESDPSRASFLGNILLTLLTLGSIASLCSYFFSRPLMLLLTNENYLSTASLAGADTALQLLSFPMFLGMIITFCFYLLLILHSWRMLLIFTSGAALLSVLLNLFLIPLFGFTGAAMTQIAVHILLAIGLSGLTIYKVAVYLPFASFARWFAMSISLGFLLFLTADYLQGTLSTLIGGVLALFAALLLAWVFGVLPNSTKALWRRERGI